MKNITIYGIPNCDVTKKVIAWLKKNNIVFDFHDYKKEVISAAKLNSWSNKKGWEVLLNKRGTAWKAISPEIQKKITGQSAAVSLMQEHTSLIKRPVIEKNSTILVGYNEAEYKEFLLMDN